MSLTKIKLHCEYNVLYEIFMFSRHLCKNAIQSGFLNIRQQHNLRTKVLFQIGCGSYR